MAIAIIGSPKFILLDEPTEGLDTQAKHMLWEVFQNLRKAGKTLILATRRYDITVFRVALARLFLSLGF